MKKLKYTLILISLLAISCSKGNDNTTESLQELPELSVIDISQESDWDFWVLGKQDYYFIKANAFNTLPESVLYHSSEINKDFSIFFNDNGYVDKVVFNNTIFVFRNFNGNFVDMGVVYQNGEIEIFREIETPNYNWETAITSKNASTKSTLDFRSELIRWTGHAIAGLPCALSVAGAIPTGGISLVTAGITCGLFAARLTGDIYQTTFDIENGLYDTFMTHSGTNKYDLGGTALDCAVGVATGDVIPCALETINLALAVNRDNQNSINQGSNSSLSVVEGALENGYGDIQGLVANYSLDGNANDESGNGNNCTVNNAALTTDRHGNANSTYNFQQSSTIKQYIESNSDFTINPAGEFSFSCWFNWDGNDFWYTSTIDGKNETTSYAGLMGIGVNETSGSCYNSSATRIYLNLWNTGKIGLQYVPDGCQSLTGQSTESDENAFSANSWNHVVVTHDGTGNLNIYLNNELVASRSDHSLNLTSFTSKINIGSMHSYFYSGTYPRGNTRNLFSGKIDDVRIYNKVLTPSEIQELFEQ